ncbi:glycosyltransferase [bacterium]|nr:glycosyltransferase [bacterium]
MIPDAQQPKSPPPDATVVVLAYNSERFMEGCLDALARTRGVSIEVICVDNASKDGSHAVAEAHPATTLAIRLEKNLGYSGGNNVGWRRGSAPIVVFINPDCRVLPDTLAKLLAPLRSEPDIAVTGALLYYPNSTAIQHAGGILHPNAMTEHYGVKPDHGTDWHTSRDVDYVTGALIAFRRSDLERLGGFDEEYWPAYYEETDLCYRLKREGKRIRYVADAIGYHWESPGLTRDSKRFVRTAYRSRLRFIIKNYTLGEFLFRFVPFEFRWLTGPFAKGFRLEMIRSYGAALVFALRCLARFSRRSARPN